jgi:hypothetical protein
MITKYRIWYCALVLGMLCITDSCKKENDDNNAPATPAYIEVRIKLKSANDTLTFNQSFVSDNDIEYEWTVLIDSDNNPSTGNTGLYDENTGFDVGISVSYFKHGSTLLSGNMLSYTQKDTWLLNGASGTYGHGITAYIDNTDTSLVMKADKANKEIAAIKPGNRYFASTTYYSSAGIVQDMSAIATIPNGITDRPNDVDHTFADITGVSINLDLK